MKTIALTLFAAALGFAQSQSGTSTATTPAPKHAPKPRQATAKRSRHNRPNRRQSSRPKRSKRKRSPSRPGRSWLSRTCTAITDSDGKTWNYRQTPFGISKWEETSAPAAQPAPEPSQAKSEPVVVTDLGDQLPL